ncbi:MAG TPA: DNA polymerase III subunit gamma/tau [Leucothrix sp.]|nr:DNA polymerase III subunit gamma/tau [Leucothrix sp.]
MSYQVLARKWRPQNFKEMVGQEHVLRALINALDSDRLHHAYLFTGTRGVGKTTIARILAKCLNCETGVTSEPCGTCSSCQEIVAGNFVDLIEVDAASRTKVEDTRELLDNVQYAPTRARFKVYLIDEVHMLTGHSFNALLKTLEEPPPHVKFLFATTDPQKLPVTILSRCLQFNLKRMPVDMISGHLNTILNAEKTPFDEPSLRLIARAADGSMRDALSLLDQSIAFGNNQLKEDDVREMLGTISHEPLLALLKAVSDGDGESILQQVEDMSGVTPDFEAATDAMISLLHQLAVQQVVPKAQQDDDGVIKLANELSREDVQLYYQIALNGRRDIPLSPDPRSGFEMILLRMMSFRPLREGMKLQESTASQNKASEESQLQSQLQPQQAKKKTVELTTTVEPTNGKATEQAESSKDTVANKPKLAPQTPAKVVEDPPPWDYNNTDANGSTPINNELNNDAVQEGSDTKNTEIKEPVKSEASPEPNNNPVKNLLWHDVVPLLKLEGRSAELIKHCLLESEDNDTICLLLDKSSEGLLAESVKQQIESALAGFYGRKISLILKVAESECTEIGSETSSETSSGINSPVSSGASGINNNATKNETPAQRSARLIAEKQQQAEQNIADDPFVIELQNRFGAKLVPGSVKPK